MNETHKRFSCRRASGRMEAALHGYFANQRKTTRFWSASMRLKNLVILRRIAACILLFAFTPTHALEAMEPCANPPSDEWEFLSAPPPESAQMLAITSKQGPIQAAEMPAQNDAWFHSKSGAYRYCRSTRPTDRCYAGTAFTDFQLRNGQWYVASAGSTSNCPVHPQKCRAAPIFKNTDTRLDGKRINTPVEQPVALRHIVDGLSDKWAPPSRDVYMAIALQKHTDKDYLHFCIENTSIHPLTLNESTLPWNVPQLFTFTVLNASGTVVFTSSPIIDRIIPGPVPHTVNAADSVEGDIEFSRFPFYDAAAKENLLVMWSGPIALYEEHNPGGIEMPVSGIMYVPKH